MQSLHRQQGLWPALLRAQQRQGRWGLRERARQRKASRANACVLTLDISKALTHQSNHRILWRRDRDSNPGYLAGYTPSKRRPSAARPSLRSIAGLSESTTIGAPRLLPPAPVTPASRHLRRDILLHIT